MSVQERVRYHEYMRPRLTNPTYSSNNVGATMGLIYMPQNQSSLMKLSSPEVMDTKIYPSNNQKNLSKNYSTNQHQNIQYDNAQLKLQKQRTKSNLSNYGTKSLRNLPQINDNSSTIPTNQNPVPNSNSEAELGGNIKNNVSYRPINERDIYQKQQKKYNIITIQPKQFNETIKKYPIYRLENIDQNYYKKLQLEDQYNRMYKNMQPEQYVGNRVVEEGKGNGTINNNYSKINQYESMKSNGEKEKYKGFRPKMLNNIDQLGGVL